MYPHTTRLIVLFFLISASFAAAARAQSVPHSERCRGRITSFGSDSIEYEGQGNATHFGRYTIIGSHDFDEQGNIFNGTFTTTTADGSTVWGTYTGTTTVLPGGEGRSDLQVVWLGGTGRFEGVTGEGVVVCFHGLTSGAHLEYSTEGTLTRP
jgi:hypothetical protein